MKANRVGVILNGVTGRMGANQHLMRSIVPIIRDGGVPLGADETIIPDPILVGRNAGKLEKLCERSGIKKMTTHLEEALADPGNLIYFDAQTTGRRADGVRQAVQAGKHVYCEKPVAVDVKTALDLHASCQKPGVKSGVVQGKLWLGKEVSKRVTDG